MNVVVITYETEILVFAKNDTELLSYCLQNIIKNVGYSTTTYYYSGGETLGLCLCSLYWSACHMLQSFRNQFDWHFV